MAKSKNHTSHTANYKNHRNGIKKPKAQRYSSTKGMYQEYKANLKFVRQGNEKAQKIVKEKLAAAQKSAEPVKKAAKKAILHKRHNPYRLHRGAETPDQRKARVDKQKKASAQLKASKQAAKKATTVAKK